MNASYSVWHLVLASLVIATGARAQSSTPAPVPPARAPAETEAALPLAEAVRSALAYFPTVKGAREDLVGATAALNEEKAAWFPSLKLVGSATRYEEPALVHPIHSLDLAVFPPFNPTLLQGGLAATYTVFDGGGRQGRVGEARGQQGAAAEALTGSEQELIARVATKYSEVLARRDVLEAHRRRIEALQSERARVRKFLEAGKAAEIDSLRVDAALAAADAERVRLEADLALSEHDLASFTGVSPDRARAANLVAVALADTTIEPADQAIPRALEQNADVRAARERRAAAEASVRAARGAYWPLISLTGNYQVWSDIDGTSTGEWNVGVQLTQPLFTGGAISSRVAMHSAANRRAEESLRLARIQTTRDVQAAHARVRQAAAAVQSLRTAAASYEEVARIEALSREVGSGTQTDYLNAEADVVSARARLAEAQHTEIAARLELARLGGDLSLAWLDRHLEARP